MTTTQTQHVTKGRTSEIYYLIVKTVNGDDEERTNERGRGCVRVKIACVQLSRSQSLGAQLVMD